MRTFFLILLLANLGFYAYAHYLRPAANAGADPKKLEIVPEKIRLLNNAKSAAAPGAAVTACIEWGAFAGPSAARADAVVADLALPEAQVRRVATDVDGFWVFVPPTKTRGAADKNIARLRENGVTEFALVLDQSQWRFAISLGIFKSEEAARRLAAAVKGKGIEDVQLERRESFLRQVVFYFREPGEVAVAKLAAARAAMPESEIKAVACPVAAKG